MLRFTQTQFDEFSSSALIKFTARLTAHLSDRVPGYHAPLPAEDHNAATGELIAHARAHGMRRQEHVRRFAVLEAAARREAGQDLPDWFSGILDGPRASPSMRLIRLEDAALHLGRTSQRAEP